MGKKDLRLEWSGVLLASKQKGRATWGAMKEPDMLSGDMLDFSFWAK